MNIELVSLIRKWLRAAYTSGKVRDFVKLQNMHGLVYPL